MFLLNTCDQRPSPLLLLLLLRRRLACRVLLCFLCSCRLLAKTKHGTNLLLLMYCHSLDNSEWMRNGDYIPTRMEAQHDAANLLCGSKTNSNPESTVRGRVVWVVEIQKAPALERNSCFARGSVLICIFLRGIFYVEFRVQVLTRVVIAGEPAFLNYQFLGCGRLNPL